MLFLNSSIEVFSVFIKMLYPKKCIVCGEIIDEDEFLCDVCYKEFKQIDHTKQCFSCGMEKKHCRCAQRVYRFNGITSAFYSSDNVKRAFYSYKLSHKMHYADYFSKQMAFAVKNSFYNLKFDYICSVPTALSSKMKRGFDHSKLLCDGISKILNIKKLDNILVCRNFIKPQHTSDITKRLENVDGKYSFIREINGGRILLVDDIITTGATLDECAKQLLLAGADEVYCVTALYTLPKNIEIKKDL